MWAWWPQGEVGRGRPISGGKPGSIRCCSAAGADNGTSHQGSSRPERRGEDAGGAGGGVGGLAVETAALERAKLCDEGVVSIDTTWPRLSKGPYWEVGGHGSAAAGLRDPKARL